MLVFSPVAQIFHLVNWLKKNKELMYMQTILILNITETL